MPTWKMPRLRHLDTGRAEVDRATGAAEWREQTSPTIYNARLLRTESAERAPSGAMTPSGWWMPSSRGYGGTGRPRRTRALHHRAVRHAARGDAWLDEIDGRCGGW